MHARNDQVGQTPTRSPRGTGPNQGESAPRLTKEAPRKWARELPGTTRELPQHGIPQHGLSQHGSSLSTSVALGVLSWTGEDGLMGMYRVCVGGEMRKTRVGGKKRYRARDATWEGRTRAAFQQQMPELRRPAPGGTASNRPTPRAALAFPRPHRAVPAPTGAPRSSVLHAGKCTLR